VSTFLAYTIHQVCDTYNGSLGLAFSPIVIPRTNSAFATGTHAVTISIITSTQQTAAVKPGVNFMLCGHSCYTHYGEEKEDAVDFHGGRLWLKVLSKC